MLRSLAAIAGLLVPITLGACVVPAEGEAPPPEDEVADFEAESAGQLACAVSQVAGGAALVGSVACWVPAVATSGAASPVCVWLASAGVTALKLTNSAAQCVTGCALVGKVCKSVAASFSGKVPTTARIANVGCNARGDFAAEADVCGLGLNRIYPRGTPEARACVPGKPTGFWALSAAERNYIRDPRNCAARGFR